jgi:hypothetical protein
MQPPKFIIVNEERIPFFYDRNQGHTPTVHIITHQRFDHLVTTKLVVQEGLRRVAFMRYVCLNCDWWNDPV